MPVYSQTRTDTCTYTVKLQEVEGCRPQKTKSELPLPDPVFMDKIPDNHLSEEKGSPHTPAPLSLCLSLNLCFRFTYWKYQC